MAFESYFDWSEHWYAYPENTSMDSLGHRKSISVTKENYGSSTLTFFREPFESNELKNTKKLGAVENTYHLNPPKKFLPDQVTTIIKNVLEKHLADKQYDHTEIKSITKIVTDELKTRVKELNFKRYKFITHVMIGENKDQAVRIGSRFLWDTDRDNFASASYKSKSLFATGIVYACYYE